MISDITGCKYPESPFVYSADDRLLLMDAVHTPLELEEREAWGQRWAKVSTERISWLTWVPAN